MDTNTELLPETAELPLAYDLKTGLPFPTADALAPWDDEADQEIALQDADILGTEDETTILH